VTPDGGRVYLAVADGVSVIDTATNIVIATIRTGAENFGVAVSPDGSKVYVANPGNSGFMSVIDTATNTIIDKIAVGGFPWSVAVSPDASKVYVTNLNGVVQVIAAATNTVTATIPTGDGNELFGGLAVSPDGSKVYAAIVNSFAISVIDTATNTVNTITVDPNPIGVAFTPDGSKAYVAIADANIVSVIDTATNTVINTIPVGGVPVAFGIFIQPAQRFAGIPGKANCHRQSVSALAKQYGGLNNAAAALGFTSVNALQAAILGFCET
jgi:YVTN family beta-propeller protein